MDYILQFTYIFNILRVKISPQILYDVELIPSYWNLPSILTCQVNRKRMSIYYNFSKTSLHLVITNPVCKETIACDVSTGKLHPYVPPSLCRDVFSVVHGLSHPEANASVHLLIDKFVRL